MVKGGIIATLIAFIFKEPVITFFKAVWLISFVQVPALLKPEEKQPLLL